MNYKIKLIKIIGPFKVYSVDGSYIRKYINPEFTNFGQHYTFSFIPEKEFFIDSNYKESELRFFIDHLLIENRLMKEGHSYEEALAFADRIEKSERPKPIKIEDIKYDELDIDKIKLFNLYKNIWIVNEEEIRNQLFIEFTEGGHDLVYPWIPENEIWIGDDVKVKERVFIILHELIERRLMKKGLNYNKAHEKATFFEQMVRFKNKLNSINLIKELLKS